MRVYNGRIYVVNRFGQDNIQVIDPADGFATIRQFTTGNGSNPQDIVFASPSKAYVSRYGSADLMIVDPQNGSTRGFISLAGFADSDGLPEMAHMAIVHPWLFVACQRLTNFQPVNTSIVAVIDTRTDELVDRELIVPGIQGITLAGRNPISAFTYDPDRRELLIGCAGAFGVADGGIERIDASAPQSLGYAITEAAIGGDVLDIAWYSSTHSYAIVNDAAFNNMLVSWSPAAGAAIDTVYAPGGFTLPDCAINGLGEIYVCDSRMTSPGMRVFRAGADTLITGPINTGLPPVQVAFR
jgi:DNA-binding beta-propeller fold protein YncE